MEALEGNRKGVSGQHRAPAALYPRYKCITKLLIYSSCWPRSSKWNKWADVVLRFYPGVIPTCLIPSGLYFVSHLVFSHYPVFLSAQTMLACNICAFRRSDLCVQFCLCSCALICLFSSAVLRYVTTLFQLGEMRKLLWIASRWRFWMGRWYVSTGTVPSSSSYRPMRFSVIPPQHATYCLFSVNQPFSGLGPEFTLAYRLASCKVRNEAFYRNFTTVY